MSEKLVSRVIQVQYHRNGIGGAGFYAVLFESGTSYKYDEVEGHLFVAIVHDEPGYCSVLRVPDLSDARGVTFGLNSWRGHRYEPELRAAIAEWDTGRIGPFSAPDPVSVAEAVNAVRKEGPR